MAKALLVIVINVLAVLMLPAILCGEAINSKNKISETIIPRKACPENENNEQPPNRVNTSAQLDALRALMSSREEQIQAVFVTNSDEHQTEFVSDHDKRLQYISGFSGSNGNAIVTMEKAILYTDGRYHIQANEEMDCNWILVKSWPTELLQESLPDLAKVGTDPKLISAPEWKDWQSKLKKANQNFTLVETGNLIDAIWQDRNETDVKPGFTLNSTYTGKEWSEKINETRKALKDLGTDAMVVTSLDEIAWLLNIRGYDIPYSNLLKSYLILTQNETVLYADPERVDGDINNFFEDTLVKLQDYHAIWTDLPVYAQRQKFLVPSSYGYSAGASKAIYDLVPESNRLVKESPIIDLKAKKNPTEILNMERSHLRDSVALCKFLHHFESGFQAGKEWDELRVAEVLQMFRSQEALFMNISFPTIAGFGAHGAMPHYLPTVFSSSKIFDNSTLVLDSGGQYYDGTTDVTRTLHLGVPTKEQKEGYTRVLMGSIQLSSLIFPSNLDTNGVDVLARAPLWEMGYDYPHGTGHGIGVSLVVHESPVNLHYRPGKSYSLKPGYFLSNEPGYYLEDEFGIRLENAVQVVEKSNLKDSRGNSYLGFKDVTLVPYEPKLIDFKLLENSHIRWLNAYNARIRDTVGHQLLLQNVTDVLAWLQEKTKYIPEMVQPAI